MTRTMLALTLAAAMFAGCSSKTKDTSMTCCEAESGKIRHVVMFKFKPGTTPEKITEIENGFGAMRGKIPQIIGYEWGTNISTEGRDMGYTHCFLVTFADTAARDAYLPHPAHKEFVTMLLPHLEDAHVLDYQVRGE